MRSARKPDDRGFTIVELMIVVLILGILTAIAIPVYQRARAQTALRTCRENQRVLEGAAQTWMAVGGNRRLSDLAGVVDAANPLIVEHIVGTPPTCPSTDEPADPRNPTASEGAYTFDASGNIGACPHGDLGPHGHY